MAISDRITSIEEHIKESYQELEGIGIDTTGVNNNLENIPKLIDGYWETLPKVTGEGTSITLDNTKEGKMKINLKGNTSQAGTPTPDSPIPIQVVSGDNSINVVGKNLFKPTLQNNGTNIMLNNISSCSISNGEFSFTASGTDMYFGNVKNTGSEYSDERGIKIFRYDNDYISFNLSNTLLNRTYITAYDSNNISLGFININSNQGTYQFPSGCDYITIRFGKTSAISGTTYKTTIMVAYGNTIPTYEPYQDNTYNINLSSGMELCKIGDYQDYIYKDNGSWYLHKEIGKVVFTGGNDETWNISETSTSGSNRFLNESIANLVTKPSADSVTINTLSNNFVAKSANQTYSNQEGIDINKIGNLHIYSDTTKNYTVAQFKTWLSTHNTIVYYPLATPTYTEITNSTLISQLNALARSYTSQTNISQVSNDLASILNATALEEM